MRFTPLHPRAAHGKTHTPLRAMFRDLRAARAVNICGHPDRPHKAKGRCQSCYDVMRSTIPPHLCDFTTEE